MTTPTAIGFFDSGVGGFSVLRHALNTVGGIPLLYAADSAYAPYGLRRAEDVRQRCRLISRFLRVQGAAAIVVACNTATALAIESLRADLDIPVIGMEPAIKPAVSMSQSRRIAVLATAGTLNSDRYARLRDDHGRMVEVHERICHGWVEAVEQGDLDGPSVYDRVHADLQPLHARGVDTYVLGCTHFPFLIDTIRAVIGEGVGLIDPGPAVVRELRRRLAIADRASAASPVRLFSSADPSVLTRLAHELIDLDVATEALPF